MVRKVAYMGVERSKKSKIDKNGFKHTQTITKTNLDDIRYHPGPHQVDLLTPLSGAPERPLSGAQIFGNFFIEISEKFWG